MQPHHARTLRTVWIALVALHTVLLPVPFFLSLPESKDLDFLPPLLAVLAIGEGIAVGVLFRSQVLQPVQDGRADLATDAGFAPVMNALTRVWGIALSVALYGGLLRLLGFDPLWSVPFIAGAAVLFWATRPWHPGLRQA